MFSAFNAVKMERRRGGTKLRIATFLMRGDRLGAADPRIHMHSRTLTMSRINHKNPRIFQPAMVQPWETVRIISKHQHIEQHFESLVATDDSYTIAQTTLALNGDASHTLLSAIVASCPAPW